MNRFLILAAIFLISLGAATLAEKPSEEDQRKRAEKAFREGNYKDAYEIYSKLALNPGTDRERVGADFTQAIQCLNALNRMHEIDAFREKSVEIHANNGRFLWTAALSFLDGRNHGYITAGKFYRGYGRTQGKFVNSRERDRIRALQLMKQAREKLAGEKDAQLLSRFHTDFARTIMAFRSDRQAWKLQYLSDLGTLPDYDEYYYGSDGPLGAPVDEEGNPILYKIPESFEAAKNDGERWRWMLHKGLQLAPNRANEILTTIASFLRSQFGVQTLLSHGGFFNLQADEEAEAGIYTLHTLKEEETIAMLATGAKRIVLPEGFRFIEIFRQISEGPGAGYAENAWNVLAGIFENRRQYDKAAECWLENIERFGPGHNNHKKKRRNQILGNFGQFEPAPVQPEGKGAVVDYRFRNGTKVRFEAREIRVQELLKDLKDYIKSNPSKLEWDRVNIGGIGYQLVQGEKDKYVGESVASWELDLKPRPRHFDRRITVTTPLQEAGAYLLEARMEDGNTSKAVLWVHDTVIVEKPLQEGVWFYVADARSGKPVSKANVEFFGYRQEWLKRKDRSRTRSFNIHTMNFAEYTGQDGQLILDPEREYNRYNWLVTATTKTGRLAFFGFSSLWHGGRSHEVYHRTKTFVITDRPVYRPSQTVNFKCWVRQAKYDQEGQSIHAGQSFKVEIFDPKGEKILDKTYTADSFGGFDDAYTLPEEATLGVYRIQTSHGGGTFRVEEYKKPEFEVKVEAPAEPVMLGDTITATIKADYYFGAPVTKASVKYKVLRSSHRAQWYPAGTWDWFYGPGYWWFAYDYEWYPGWNEWGLRKPHPWWIPFDAGPPEVVMENEVEIGEEGFVKIDIDTSFAKEAYGHQDHRYQIIAEVRDESRRTIVGTGSVLAARKPFKVYVWLDKGYYRQGDRISAEFQAQSLDGKPIKGTGEVTLFKISYDEKNQPEETKAFSWKLNTNSEGRAMLQYNATAGGQYRLSYKLTDERGRTEEGGYIYQIWGEGYDGSEIRFNQLELIADKKEYVWGEKLNLMVNTDRLDSRVFLFIRPENGSYLKPKMLRIQGKSALFEMRTTRSDMPNFFIEGLTVSNGRVYREVREIIVPPRKRVLDVDVLTHLKKYRPGQKAKMRIRVKDSRGKPFAGVAAMTVYDKSLEYISGGTNVPEIREYFWKWRRRHYPREQTNLGGWYAYGAVHTSPAMEYLGAFGYLVPPGEEGELDMEQGELGARLPESRARKFKGAVEAKKEAAGEDMLREEGMELGKQWNAEEPGREEPLVEPMIRTKFADTAFWAATITTDADGFADVEFEMPENLTTWKVKTWALGHGTKVGEGEVEVLTTKYLIVRLQAPRFFVERDEVVLSANVHNYIMDPVKAKVVLELDGGCLEALSDGEQTVSIDPQGEARVDWRVKVVREGEAVVRMKALTNIASDAMEMRFPVYVHGMAKTESFSGAIRPDQGGARVAYRVPEERRIDESRLEIRYSPTLAGAMVDALPYLAEYPYGCTEQTLNRFLPSVITQKILLDMGLSLAEIREKQVNLNAQETGDPKERAERWKSWKRNPVFDEKELSRMVKQGVRDLTNMQVSDGGWGWFSGYGERSYPHTTAVVVHGLQVARDNDVAIVPGVLEKGIEWLKQYQDEQVRRIKNAPKEIKPWKPYADNLDAFVFMVLGDANIVDEEMREFLYRDRTKLTLYSKAMFGLALHAQGEEVKLAMIQRNIEQYLVRDEENQTAYLDLGGGAWWYWYGSEYETLAYYLKFLSKVEPKSEKAAGLAKYLINNRRHGTYWNSTRDTALCIEALADYMRASEEDRPEMTVEILIDGRKWKEVEINSENLFSFDNVLLLHGDAVESGEHVIEFKKTGKGPLYFNAYLTYFSLEDFITKAGLEVKVERKYYKLVPVDKKVAASGARGQAMQKKVEKYEREPLENLTRLKSGDLVEIELEIESKNDYEYLLFEDMKAAGFEPEEVRSGYIRNGMGAYMELRDERVTFFVRFLNRGKHSIAYRMRAEIPGAFSALPTRAYAMYAPELKGNSDEFKLRIED